MPGNFTSMPNSAVPLTFDGVSRRFVALPTILKSFGSLSLTSVGTGIFEAASASEP